MTHSTTTVQPQNLRSSLSMTCGSKCCFDIIPHRPQRISEKYRKLLCSVYGNATVDKSFNGRWEKIVTASETGKKELHDLCRSDRSVATVSPDMLQRADAITREGRSITARQPALSPSISKGSVGNIHRDHRNSKLCAI
jgi:hypothetical protein